MFPPKPFSSPNFRGLNELKALRDDEFCDPSITGLLFGFDREQCNKTLMEWASTSTSSVRGIIHYGQLITSGKNHHNYHANLKIIICNRDILLEALLI